MRPLKDGGCSLCNASDENVGKRRCRHVLDTANIVSVERNDKMNWIDIDGISDGRETNLSIQANDKQIKEYIKTLSSALTKKEKETILALLQDE